MNMITLFAQRYMYVFDKYGRKVYLRVYAWPWQSDEMMRIYHDRLVVAVWSKDVPHNVSLR